MSDQQFVALTRALADAGEDRNALVALRPWRGSVPSPGPSCPRRRRRTSPPCRPDASGISRSITLMPVSNTVVAAVCAESGGGARWIGQPGCLGRQRRPMVVHCAGHIEQPAEHRIPHWSGQWSPGGEHRAAPGQAGGGMDGDGPRRGGVKMALHLGYEPTIRVNVDAQRLADAW